MKKAIANLRVTLDGDDLSDRVKSITTGGTSGFGRDWAKVELFEELPTAEQILSSGGLDVGRFAQVYNLDAVIESVEVIDEEIVYTLRSL